MRDSLHILMLGKDPTLFQSDATTFGDTRRRHIAYAEALRRRRPGSSIRIITYTAASQRRQAEEVSEGLTIYGTASLHRATYLAGILKRLPGVLAKGWRPDIVTVQTPWEEGSLGYLLARMLRARYLPQVHFDLFSEEWKKEHWLNPWRKLVACTLLKRADRIRVVSAFQREDTNRELGISCDNIWTVPVGVNFRPVSGAKEQLRKKVSPDLDGKKIVLFVGRFYAPKNLGLWVDVAELIGKQVPEAVFVMAGNGVEFARIRALVADKGLAERFYFPGVVGHEALPEIYAAADVFLLTSHYEGFGRVVIEACLAGLPVVSTMCGGPEELIDSGRTGFLVPKGDVSGLAEAVVCLLRDDIRRQQFGRLGKAKIEAEYSFEVLVERLISFWEGVPVQ